MIKIKNTINRISLIIIVGLFYYCTLPCAYAIKPQFDLKDYAEEECLDNLSGKKKVNNETLRSNLEIGVETSFIKYREPGVMREQGIMYGVAGSYAYHHKIMLKVESRGSWGSIDYRNSGAVNNINDYILESRGLGGYDFPILGRYTLTPYIGFGYRYLNDDMSDKVSSTGARGYERESNYFYSPVGIEAIASLENNWSIGLTGEYDIFWLGKQVSHLSDVPGYKDSKNRQTRGHGFRGSVKMQKNFERINVVLEPFIRYWGIKESRHTSQGFEPKNHSTEIGSKLAVQF